MKEFTKPYLEIIMFSSKDVVVTSGNNCDQGLENMGYNCGDGKKVFCDTAISRV